MKLMRKTMPRGGRGKAYPGRTFKSSQRAGGTPGANNPSSGVRGRTIRQGKGIVPPVAKTPKKTKQKNPKGKRSVMSTPVRGKRTSISKRMVTGGSKGLTPKMRGGLGSARPNYGKLRPFKAVGGR